jgi:hypothetical protein
MRVSSRGRTGGNRGTSWLSFRALIDRVCGRDPVLARDAEGATRPETLRHKDRTSWSALERGRNRPTEGAGGERRCVISQVIRTEGRPVAYDLQ